MRFPAFTRLFALALLVGCKSLGAEGLTQRIDAIVATIPSGGQAGVVVADADRGRILYAHDADRLLSIASVTKSLVAAAALWDLGPDYRFRTRVVALGPVVAGAVPGLAVIGGGSPCFDEHFFADDPSRVFREWAATLKERGIERIDGDLLIDASLFSGPVRPDTYPQDAENQSRWYSAPASAFAWNDNCIEVRVVPRKPGEPAEVQVRPRSSRIVLRNLTKTVTGKTDNAIHVTRDADANGVTVSGSYARATEWFPLAIHDQPDLLAGDELKAAFVEAGIALSGQVTLGAAPRDAPALIDLAQPLVPALTVMNQRSQNFYGEQLLRVLGAHRRHDGSIVAGTAAVADLLAEHVPGAATGAALIDGSGLSYGNRASAGFIVATYLALHGSPLREAFYGSLKIDEVVKPPAHVKTGTLAIAACIAGFIDRPDGGRWAFAVLLNKGEAKGFGWGAATRERLLKAIAAGP